VLYLRDDLKNFFLTKDNSKNFIFPVRIVAGNRPPIPPSLRNYCVLDPYKVCYNIRYIDF
jgi:hypothetical protein